MIVLSTVVAFCLQITVAGAASLEPVNLQLKWYHQFQFAGYYAAQAKGFYRDEHLAVNIMEGGPDSPAIKAVLSGAAQYGIGDSDILLARMQGKPIVAVAAIFQHSPYVILSRRDQHIRTPADLIGKRVMLSNDQGAAQFKAMLVHEGIDINRINIRPHSWNIQDLVQGKVDAVSAYATVEPAQLKRLGIAPEVMSSMNYGVDFYGDALFTSEAEVSAHSARVAAFLRATQLGWVYALSHPEEIADLIMKMPGVAKRGITREILLDEAKDMRPYILPDLVDVGHMSPNRWQYAADTMISLGIAPVQHDLSGFMYQPPTINPRILVWSVGTAVAALAVIGLVALWNVQIRRNVKVRTQQLLAEISHREQVEAMLKIAGQAARLGGWVIELPERKLIWSDEVAAIHDMPPGNIPPLEDGINYFLPEGRALIEKALNECINEGKPYDLEVQKITAKGRKVWVRTIGQAVRDADGNIIRIEGAIQDITDRKQTELAMVELNRALRMLSGCNELLIRATDEIQLLTDICRLAVEVGGYRMAWVGYAQDDEYHSIKPVGFFGQNNEFLTALKLSWSEDNPRGLGPGGKTIREGRTIVDEDILADPHYPAQADALAQGYHGVVSLPLRNRQRTFGLLALYTSEVRQIKEDEIKMLEEMADDLAFGITNLRAEAERQRIQDAVLKVSAAVSATTGKEFFEQLMQNMAEALGAQAACVARLLPGLPLSARTIASIVDGKVTDNFDYMIDDTPCRALIKGEDCVINAAVARKFPESPSLSALNAEAYAGSPLINSAGQVIGLLFIIFREPLQQSGFITSTLRIFAARAAAELERQEADVHIREQASLLDKAQDAITVRTVDNVIKFWNKSAERLYGWRAEEMLDRLADNLLYEDIDFVRASMRKLMEQGEWSGELVKRRKDGSTLTVEAHWTLVRDDQGKAQSILAIDTDISHRKAAEQEIQKLAFYDPLTGLPNRLLLLDRLERILVANARSGRSGALLFIDLDNFKTLNDTLGHDMGDLLLKQVAGLIAGCVRESDTVARLGGDEFVVVLNELSANLQEAAEQAKNVGEKILLAFNHPFHIMGREHHTTPSIGITLFSDNQDTLDELLKRADLAMYQAKAAGRNTLRFFDPEMQAAINHRVELEANLRLALQQEEFILHYQPQINSDGCLIGAESLVRWQDPVRGMISPVEFIPLAEDTGLILPLGEWVLRTACTQLATWAANPKTAKLTMAVNVSARQFRHPGFVEQVLSIVSSKAVNPQLLKLELTESLLVDNVEETITKMQALKARGVGFSLDDFGTGYSSLSYLKRLPLDQLKIDRSFVRDVLVDPNDAAIARTIIALGQSLNLAVIAEGVETEEQRAFLAGHDCHAYQGYFFSKPLSVDEFAEFVSHNRCQS
jgi:diguanylate cyclase (GGDEF)-like protein/PAS domain S-box-containing protein